MMVAIVFLSFFMLSAAFMMLSYRYIIAEKRDAMERNADYIASFTSEYIQQSGSLDVYFRSYVATLASVSDSNVLLSDVDGDIIYASGGSSSDLSNYTDSRIPQRVLQQVLSSGSYNGLTNLDGIYSEKRYLAAYPFGIIFGGATIPQGLVLVSSDTSSVSEMWRATATIFFFTAVTVLLIAVIASSITSSHQVRPLNEMAEAARKFGQGEFDVRVTGYETRCDEVGTLAEAFNSMAASLSKVETQRSEFIANVSHELKTPMTTISGFAEGILDGTIGKDQERHYLRIVSDEVKRLSRLVRSMLNLSRIEAGELKIQTTPFNILEIICETVFSFEQSIDQKHLDIRGLDTDKVMVDADPDLIHQVVYNLVDNAVKFVNDGGYLEFSFNVDGSRTYVGIRNSGEGLSKEEIPRVFDRFYKTDRSRGVDKNGVGLGLYLVRSIINLHGGDIIVKSVQGEYTEFVFSVPTAKAKNPALVKGREKEYPNQQSKELPPQS